MARPVGCISAAQRIGAVQTALKPYVSPDSSRNVARRT